METPLTIQESDLVLEHQLPIIVESKTYYGRLISLSTRHPSDFDKRLNIATFEMNQGTKITSFLIPPGNLHDLLIKEFIFLWDSDCFGRKIEIWKSEGEWHLDDAD